MGVADVLLQIHALVIIARPRERVLELAEALSVVDRRVVNSALRRAGDLDDDVAAAIEAA